jgi:hypothetical protein
LLEKDEKRPDNTRKSSTGISRNKAYFEKLGKEQVSVVHKNPP